MLVTDPTQTQPIPVGKQWSGEPRGDLLQFIMYTSTSGIWQTVWLEPVVEEEVVETLQVETDLDNRELRLTVITTSGQAGQARVLIEAEGQTVAEASIETNRTAKISLGSVIKTWSPQQPFLYDMKVTLTASGDSVTSYFGMRKVEIRSERNVQQFYLNNQRVPFQVGPLDQGYWPDGILTPPSEEALKWDLEQTKLMGFNMVRKHIKIESRRWYYWADKLGLLVWQDFPSITDTLPLIPQSARDQFRSEAGRWLHQLQPHPSIVLWVVFNEGWGQHDTQDVTEFVMAADPSRLVSCASGWTDFPVGHTVDVHVYPGPSLNVIPDTTRIYAVDPSRLAVVGEMWGKSRAMQGHNWFGDQMVVQDPRGVIASADQFITEYSQVVRELLELRESHGYAAAVMTQTTDVEAELNGFLTYDRRELKCDQVKLAELNTILYSADIEAVQQFLSQPQPSASTWSGPVSSHRENDQVENNLDKLSFLISEGIIQPTNTVYCFHISDCATKWFLDMKTGTYTRETLGEPADTKIKMTSDNFQKVFSGQLSPAAAFLTFRLGVSGNLRKAVKLRHIVATVIAQSNRNTEGNPSVDELFQVMSSLITEDLVRENQAVFVFYLRDQMLEYYLDLKNGAGACGRGPPSSPADATLTMTLENFNKMFTGKLKTVSAYMTGKLKIRGNLAVATKLEKLMATFDIINVYKSIVNE